jgi:hypothetical protein
MDPAPSGIVITIVATPDGQVRVSGPLDNKLLCYGMLEIARQQVQAFEQSKIIKPMI